MAYQALSIWGDFKMKASSPIKKISAFKHTVLTLAVLMLLGWLILLSVLFYLWMSHDIDASYQFAEHLSSHPLAYLRGTPAETLSNSPLLNDMQHDGHKCWTLIRAANDVMSTKFMTLLSAIPLFFLSIMAGLIDGLNQRAIRAACLGRESTYVFHKTVPLARTIICGVLGIWLCVPMRLPTATIFVSLAVMLGLVMRVSASRFKKYL